MQVVSSLISITLVVFGSHIQQKQISECLSNDKIHFDSLERGLGVVSKAQFAHGLSRKIFLSLHSKKMFITIICFPVYDVVNFVRPKIKRS